MTVGRKDLIERRLVAIVRRQPGRFRPNELVREAGFRRRDALAAIKRLVARSDLRSDRDGRLTLNGDS